MSERSLDGARRVPLRALGLSFAALLVPVIGALRFPDQLGEVGMLLWLVALIPAFLLAYHRGWSGVATALAIGMATLSITQAVANSLGGEVPDLLFPIVVAYLAISLGIGWVTELLHRERTDIENLALTDSLTELPNRRHAMVFLENEFGAAERGRPLAVALFDVDNFKEYNDRFGHQAGDEALQKFGETLLSTTRRMNLSARFGGEEFLTILAGSEAEGAHIFAERVQEALLLEQPSQGQLTVSAGVAAYHPSMGSPDELLAAADAALYRAKAEGRNRVRVFGRPDDSATETEDAMHEAVLEKLRATGPCPEYGGAHGSSGPAPPQLLILSKQITGRADDPSALVVENSAPVRRLISTVLGREGFSVVEAPTPSEGLRALSREFDMVLAEVGTPSAAGKELISVAKARWPGSQVLALTEFRQGASIAEALDAPADRCLFKPFGVPELRAHLLDALSRSRLEASGEATPSGELPPEWKAARRTILKSTRALVTVIEARAPWVRGHATRVANYAEALARAMGDATGRLELDTFRIACELHDVGKIAIPEGVLSKEGPRTPEELLWIQRHPVLGRRLLEPIPDGGLFATVAGGHHERWDGEGYPEGRAGEGIPLPARIVAVANVLDSLAGPTAHRGELPWDEAVEETLGRFGSHFDPNLEGPFRDALPAIEELFSKERGPFQHESANLSPEPVVHRVRDPGDDPGLG